MAYFMVNPEVLGYFREDIPQMHELKMLHMKSDNLTRLYLISHWPRRSPTSQTAKMQADAIRETLESCQELSNQMVEWSKWEVLVEVRREADTNVLAAKLQNWESLSLTSM